MIKTQNLTPEIYYKESRDFQYFGRVFDIVFNYLKTNVDLMENFPINQHTDSKLIELLARTLGFENKTDYRNDELNAICNTFISIIREKGSEKSIHKLVKTILNVEGITDKYDIYIPGPDSQELPKTIVINLPDIITNPEIKLLEDVLDYILPIGYCYNIRRVSVFEGPKTEIQVKEFARATNLADSNDVYTNLQIARDNTRMQSSGTTDTSSSIGHQADIQNPIMGDMRYTRVTKKTEGDD